MQTEGGELRQSREFLQSRIGHACVAQVKRVETLELRKLLQSRVRHLRAEQCNCNHGFIRKFLIPGNLAPQLLDELDDLVLRNILFDNDRGHRIGASPNH